MVKNLHFCTPKLLKLVKDPETKTIRTIRTGFVPSIYEGDVINLTQFVKGGKDTFICKGVVQGVNPIRRSQLNDMYKPRNSCIEEELKRYNRKFNWNHWFFTIEVRKYTKDLVEFIKAHKSEEEDE